MSNLSDQLFNHIVKLQERADSSYEQYNSDRGLIPNDCVYIMRLSNLRSVTDLIAELVEKSGKPLKDVLRLSIEPHISDISDMYMLTGQCIERLVKDFG